MALADPDLLEPELVAWKDRTTSMASPELEGCSGPYGRRDYSISHDGRLEVDVGGEAIFIFAESSPAIPAGTSVPGRSSTFATTKATK